MKKAIDQIKHLTPCMGAVVWLGGRTVEEMIQECPRGDWLFWLAARFGIGLRKLTLAKGLSAKTVIHLMEEERSRDAVKAAIAYGRYRIGDEELEASAAAYATYATYATWASAAASAAYATWAAYAADAASAAFYATSQDASANAANAAAYAASQDASANAANAANAATRRAAARAAREENRLQTADICRKVFGAQLINNINRY